MTSFLGILSWPNTTPEKIFFFKKLDCEEKNDEVMNDEEEEPEELNLVPEILTISHDPNNPNKVLFDDTNWQDHLSSLKPLGLAMLLNTCNTKTEERFTDFYHFLVSESQSSEPGKVPDLLPIPSRGCLCQLSQKIGVTQDPNIVYLDQFQSYKSVTRDSGNRAFNKNLSMAKLKFPFPHQVSVLIEEVDKGRRSLLSQGTADVILDSCQDAWTGYDLSQLQPGSRKKISEFYQRACLTSYCTTFAYKPILSSANLKERNCEYIELPSFIPTKLRNNIDEDTISVGSFDAKFLEDEIDQDTLSTLQSQSFLGMVQMQYQALVDMVQFIDMLEKVSIIFIKLCHVMVIYVIYQACIRFVHFSKENELRSRVFSEKMGLESGWNCHISLANRADVEAASSVLFGSRRKLAKKIDKKHFLISSVPDKLNHDWRLTDLPAWGGQTSQPLLEDGSVCSSDGSLSSMLEYDMNNRAQLPAGRTHTYKSFHQHFEH